MIQKFASGLILLCLLLLASCSAKPPVVIEKKMEIPDSLLNPRPIPVWGGNTNSSLVDYTLELIYQLQCSNADKQAIKRLLEEK